jgi:hypothetical protein
VHDGEWAHGETLRMLFTKLLHLKFLCILRELCG